MEMPLSKATTAQADRRADRKSRGLSWPNLAWGILLPLALLGTWSWAVASGRLPSTLIAGPGAVLKSLEVMARDGSLWSNIVASVLRLAIGFGIGTGAGVGVGILVAASTYGRRVLGPTLGALAPVPPLAWGPLLIILLGIGEEPKIALVAIGTFFVVLTGTVEGIRGTERAFLELAEVLGKSRRETLFSILLPSAVPAAFTAMRVALALSWTLLLGAEMIASSRGLGWLLQDARNFSRADDMLAAMIVIGLLGRCSDLVLAWIEKRFTPWRLTYNSAQVLPSA